MVPLGSIVCAAATSKNNATTETPFAVAGWAALMVRTSASDVYLSLVDDSTNAATIGAATGLPIPANTSTRIELQGVQGLALCLAPVLACYSTGGATVQVWGLWA